jgi:hypothetical protein
LKKSYGLCVAISRDPPLVSRDAPVAQWAGMLLGRESTSGESTERPTEPGSEYLRA